jgi:hypothetical protein
MGNGMQSLEKSIHKAISQLPELSSSIILNHLQTVQCHQPFTQIASIACTYRPSCSPLAGDLARLGEFVCDGVTALKPLGGRELLPEPGADLGIKRRLEDSGGAEAVR